MFTFSAFIGSLSVVFLVLIIPLETWFLDASTSAVGIGRMAPALEFPSYTGSERIESYCFFGENERVLSIL